MEIAGKERNSGCHSWLLWQPTTTLFRHNQYIESLEFVDLKQEETATA
jgi:hypothetical protein